MAQFCRNCGTPLPPTAKYCAKCGRPAAGYSEPDVTMDDPDDRPNERPDYEEADTPLSVDPPDDDESAADGGNSVVYDPAPEPIRAERKRTGGSARTVLLLATAVLVLAASALLVTRLIRELREDKSGTQEPAYTQATADSAPQDGLAQPAQEASADAEQEEQETDASAYRPENILELQPGQLSWTAVAGDYDLYFSVPEGFMETPIGFSVDGNIYCYYAQALDVLIRFWEAPIESVGDPGGGYLFTAYGFSVDDASLRETENSRRYTCTGDGRRISVYETWGDRYAYYFMLEYPGGSTLQTAAYEDLAEEFLSRAAFNNELTRTVSDYILPQSAERRLTSDDLEGLSHLELCLARNEIYARHGRRFKNKDIAAYFAGKDWYSPSIDASVFDANQNSYLSGDELYNATFMLEYEKRKFGKSYY